MKLGLSLSLRKAGRHKLMAWAETEFEILKWSQSESESEKKFKKFQKNLKKKKFKKKIKTFFINFL